MNKMKKVFLALLLCGPYLVAQQKPQASTPGQSAQSHAGEDSLSGCLQRSGVEYTLIDRDEILHHLSGGKSMKQYLGHQVELYGENSVRTIDTTQAGVASSAKEQAVFRIKSVKDLGPNCQ